MLIPVLPSPFSASDDNVREPARLLGSGLATKHQGVSPEQHGARATESIAGLPSHSKSALINKPTGDASTLPEQKSLIALLLSGYVLSGSVVFPQQHACTSKSSSSLEEQKTSIASPLTSTNRMVR